MVVASRRGLLSGAIGAGLAANARTDTHTGRFLRGLPPMAYTGGRAESAADMLLDPIRQAAVEAARATLERDRAANERKRRSLLRLKSVSAAWIEAQCEMLDRADNLLWEAFNKATS